MIGVDAHKQTHTLVAVDELGRKVGEKTVKATTDGHLEAVQWAAQWQRVSFAVEDCRHLTRRLEGDLLRAGLPVVRVHTKFMAAHRRSGRRPGKSDPIDALAVAHTALREPNLPTAFLDGPARQVKLLADHRGALVVERVKLVNRLRWHLHELDPELQVRSRGLRCFRVMDHVALRLSTMDGIVARLARDLVTRCRELTVQINQLERELRGLVRVLAPSLLEIPGCGVLSAAVIIGETAGVSRFHSPGAYARFNGTAPIPVWSGNNVKVRLNRGGNRAMNWALHMIAVTQARGIGPGRSYMDKQTASGKTRREALRLLRRRLSDVVYHTLLADTKQQATASQQNLELAA